MKLDRNINPDGRGKYALIQMRELDRDCAESVLNIAGNPNLGVGIPGNAIRTGAESPGDMFFVLKYKDQFAHVALRAYASAVRTEAHRLYSLGDPRCDDLNEFADEINREADMAESTGGQIPT